MLLACWVSAPQLYHRLVGIQVCAELGIKISTTTALEAKDLLLLFI